MNTFFDNNQLTLVFEGRIDTSNALNVDKEVMAAYEEHRGCQVVVDAQKLEYISSAGLRVLMKLRKAAGALTVLNVSRDVYDILEVTGFVGIMDVQRALREVNVENLEVIGQGGNGIVYRLDDDTILKLYRVAGMEDVKRERENAQKLFQRGIPTAIAYDIVKCGDQLGTVFEMLNADTLAKALQATATDDEMEPMIEQYTEIVKGFHAEEADTAETMSLHAYYNTKIDEMHDYYSAEELEKLHKLLDWIPQRSTMLHGDLHTGNLMLQNGEIMVIDVADISYGHPIFDLAGIYIIHAQLGMGGKVFGENSTGLQTERSLAFWNRFMRKYFGTEDESLLKLYEGQIAVVSLLKTCIGPAISKKKDSRLTQLIAEMVKAKLIPIIDGFVQQDPAF